MGEQVVRVVEGAETPATRVKWRPTDADHLRDYFVSKPFDQTLGAYFPADKVEHYKLKSPEKVLGLMRCALNRAGYRGWYAIVVHDKKGSTLWHPHMLLDGRNGQYNKVRRELFRLGGDVRYNSAGPVKDLGRCAGYMAMRACETGYTSDKWELEFMGENKRFRPRGSRGRRQARKPASM